MKYLSFLTVVIVGSVMTSCVSNKPIYKEDWKRLEPIANPLYSVYLIGDAGNATADGDNEVLDYLKNELKSEKENSAVIWLGDNIYPVGLAPLNSIYHKEGRNKLLAQLNTMSEFRGKKYFIPGNHDWYAYGRVGLRRQELLVDSFLLHTPNPANQDNYFLPNKGCGDPQVVGLTDDIVLLLMDSHWFLNESVRQGDQSVCDVKTADEFLVKMEDEIERNKGKSLIAVSHHPPYTYASHGGKVPLKEYVFPLTRLLEWLYIPLPVAGVVFNRMKLRLSEQDVYHPLYKKYRSRLTKALEIKGRSIVASGHEHTLQFIEHNNQYFIVSGSGTKNNKVGNGKGSKFGIGEKGFVKVVFISKNTAIVQFIVPGHFNEYNNIAYETKILLR